MILLFLFLQIYSIYCIELELKSSRLIVRPDENAYAFGELNKEKLEYFNTTIGVLKMYEHDKSINWVWKFKPGYTTKNFTSIINIFKNNKLYTKKLSITILDYIPRLTIEKNIIKSKSNILENKVEFIGNNLTVNVGNIETYMNNWYWVCKTCDIFANFKKEYISVEICVNLKICNNFFVYKNQLYFSAISYFIYIPNSLIEKDFIDILIVSIGTSDIFGIDMSKIQTNETYDNIFRVFEII